MYTYQKYVNSLLLLFIRLKCHWVCSTDIKDLDYVSKIGYLSHIDCMQLNIVEKKSTLTQTKQPKVLIS